MAVYVDNMYQNPIGNYRGMKMSHLAADTTVELLDMVKKIGVNPKWIQDKGTGGEHFDIAMSKREQAIEHGAIPLSMFTLCPAMVRRKSPDDRLEIDFEKENKRNLNSK